MPTEDVLVTVTMADGEEREERWPSLAAFHAWALGEDARCTYTAYRADEDGEWLLIERGRLGRR